MAKVTLQRHPDRVGYLVVRGDKELGVIWYARDCRCWYANPDPNSTRPDWTLGYFPTKEKAKEALS